MAEDTSYGSQSVGSSSVKMLVKMGSGILVKSDSTSQADNVFQVSFALKFRKNKGSFETIAEKRKKVILFS